MKNTKYNYLGAIVILLLLFISEAKAQVGVGTTSPDPSAMLDVISSTKGLLVPRMTTVEKNAIASAATGLLVYDTDISKFCYYNGSIWVELETNSVVRDNYVLVKSLADLPTPVGNVITLQQGTLYEINGAINIGANSIDINDCVFVGRDPYNDTINYTGGGAMFTGVLGGMIEFLNLIGNGGELFDINTTNDKNLIIRDCFISDFSSLGKVSGHSFIYFSALKFENNTDGLTFSGITELFINDYIWYESNTGTAISLNGVFDIITISGGGFYVDTGEIGVDVSANPTIILDAVIETSSFSGLGNRTNGTFSNKWSIEASGLETQKDIVAGGGIYINSQATTTISTANTPVKVSGTTAASLMFRADDDGVSNRIRYTGLSRRYFQVSATFSFNADGSWLSSDVVAFYVYKNGVQVPSIYTEMRTSSNSTISGSILGVVELETNDYIELWVANKSSTANITLNSMNLIVR